MLPGSDNNRVHPGASEKIRKDDAEWRRELSQEQYRVCRLKGTEPAGSGEYAFCKKPGIYLCVCCGLPLFDSKHKYDSGTGWPSFTAPIDAQALATADDRSHGMIRTEVLCNRCDAHLGHVFPDGPEGLRYCINSVALRLQETALK